jgi:hypothetical protein
MLILQALCLAIIIVGMAFGLFAICMAFYWAIRAAIQEIKN